MKTTIFLFGVWCSLYGCTKEKTDGYIPIADLGQSTFLDMQGGKYPGGSNNIPYGHLAAGMTSAHMGDRFEIFDAGKTDCMLILGFSTAAMTGTAFSHLYTLLQENGKLQIINGAQGGRDLRDMIEPGSTYWHGVDSALQAHAMDAASIRWIWMNTGERMLRNVEFPQAAIQQMEDMRKCMELLRDTFPALEVVFLSDRTYAGYIDPHTNAAPLAEPAAYFTSWSIKWLIENQISGKPGYGYADLPFIDWGPMLWTNGTEGNQAGYTWQRSDVVKGGVHPSAKGRMKEAALLYAFFSHSPYLEKYFNP